jgi:formate hydrogenlyase subunit 3/multisubunit Na+/H+ antiporter MnhD subunit
VNNVILPVVLPLLAAFLVQPLSRVSAVAARLLGPLVLLACFAMLLQVWLTPDFAPRAVSFGGFAPPLGIVFYVDQLALIFAIAVPLFVLLFWDWSAGAQVYGQALLLLLAAGSTGLALSGDLFNMFVSYELIAVASLGLVVLKGTGPAQIATVRYLLISAFGSVLALLGITVVYTQTGTLNLAQLGQLAPNTLHGSAGLTAFAFMLIGFGVKAELFPVNAWVPEVYATAPARIAGLMAGLVSKLAALVVLRLLIVVYHDTAAPELLLVLGSLTLVFAELAAWRAKDFPRMISYSSIAQLGVVFIAFSLPGAWGVLAGLAVALNHLLVKSAMFILAQRWSGSLDRLTGAARKASVAAGLFVLFALSLIGVPPLPGFWGKLLVLTGLVDEASWLRLAACAAVLAATAIKADYLFRFVCKLYQPSDHPHEAFRWTEIAGAAVIGVIIVVASLRIGLVTDKLRAVAEQAADRDSYISTVLPEGATAGAANVMQNKPPLPRSISPEKRSPPEMGFRGNALGERVEMRGRRERGNITGITKHNLDPVGFWEPRPQPASSRGHHDIR